MLSLMRRVVILISTGLMVIGSLGCAAWFSAESRRTDAPRRVPPSTLSPSQMTTQGKPPSGAEPTLAAPVSDAP